MYLYSGECRQGVCGTLTPLRDIADQPLSVGDIVATCTIDKLGVCYLCGLSCVVSDEFTTYSDGRCVKKEGDPIYFVMGIKNVDFMGKDSERWTVKKVKDWSDCVEGEKWKDWHFSYSEKESLIEGE